MKKSEETSSCGAVEGIQNRKSLSAPATTKPALHHLPPTGFLRLPKIIGDSKRGIPGIFPVSKSTWFEGVKTGRYPAGVKLSERCTAWRVSDILALIEQTKEAA